MSDIFPQKCIKMNKSVVFDLDGTLLNTLLDLADSTNYALRSFGFRERSPEEIRKFVGNGAKLLIERCIPEQQDSVKEEVLAVFKKHYAKNMTNKTRPYDGILEMLSSLKDRGYMLGIVSNKFDLAVKGLADIYFKDVVDEAGGENERAGIRKKPAPDSVNKTISLLHSDCEHCVYVGDSDVDVKTAHNAHIKCIGVTWGFRDEKILTDAGADYIANDAKELYDIIKEILE